MKGQHRKEYLGNNPGQKDTQMIIHCAWKTKLSHIKLFSRKKSETAKRGLPWAWPDTGC